MKTIKSHENYPAWIVLLSGFHSLAIYILGFLVLLKTGILPAVLYLVFIIAFEYRLLRYHCTNCYYWGKSCGFGKGIISSVFFKKGDCYEFSKQEFKWIHLIPDMLISLIPLITGIVLLILQFDLILLLAIILIILFISYGNGFVRGKLTCKYCKQRELGCPAEKLFNKKH